MRRFPIRWGLFAAAVLTFSVGTVAVFPTPSYAAVPSITSMGGPLNVLPSAVKAAAGASQGDLMIATMYKASKSPEFWALYKQAQATAAKTGNALVLSPEVAAEAQTIYPAATKAAPLIKTLGRAAGTAGAVITAYEVSSTLTNGTLDLLGMDATGTVCRNTGRDLWGTVVQTAAGAKCGAWDSKMAQNFVANADANGAGLTSVKTCSDVGCLQIIGTVKWGDDTVYCMNLTGVTGKPSSFNVGITYKTSIGGLTSQSGWAYNNQPFPTWGLCPQPSGGDYSTGIDVYPGSGTLTGFQWSSKYAAGSELESPYEQVADPKRTLKCVIAGTDGKQYSAESDPFFESAGVLPDPKCPDLPSGVMADSTDIVETGGEKDDTVWSAKTSDAVKNALVTTGCGTSTGTQCELQLYKDGESCFAGADCQGWYQDPERSRYKCEYGGKPVALSECTTYAPRWEPKQQASGDTLGDPDTGKPMKNPKPTLSPGSTANAGSTSADGATELGTNNCFKGMPITLNPISWVVEPFKCMFIARDGYTESVLKTYQAKADATYPAKLATMVGGLSFKGPGSGCSGIPVHIGEKIPDFTIMNACPGDMLAPAAQWGRIFLDLGITVVGLLAITKFVGSAFGFTAFGSKGDDE